MHHNYQIEEYGRCKCVCHRGKTGNTCDCGWLDIFPVDAPPRRRRIRSEKLTSRVKPFQGQYTPPISVNRGHRTHSLRDDHPENSP